jgi:hypothetical protein
LDAQERAMQHTIDRKKRAALSLIDDMKREVEL